MREISPAANMSADEVLASYGAPFRNRVEALRKQKLQGERLIPSSSLVDKSQLLDDQTRAILLDKVADLVDENLFGRSEMCMQFADLLCKSLKHLGLKARTALGKATYVFDGVQVFEWSHAWVRIGREVVDGNVDSIVENPLVRLPGPVHPYWGPIDETPCDRLLRENRSLTLSPDEDVEGIWWPELRDWLDSGGLTSRV
ncbi:MAG: hypothetical protein ACYC7C_11950 [Coriobacteriia bacterium]